MMEMEMEMVMLMLTKVPQWKARASQSQKSDKTRTQYGQYSDNPQWIQYESNGNRCSCNKGVLTGLAYI